MVIVNIIERITLTYGEDDDIIKLYELDGWKKVTDNPKRVTFEYEKSACFTSDEYRKEIMDE